MKKRLLAAAAVFIVTASCIGCGNTNGYVYNTKSGDSIRVSSVRDSGYEITNASDSFYVKKGLVVVAEGDFLDCETCDRYFEEMPSHEGVTMLENESAEMMYVYSGATYYITKVGNTGITLSFLGSIDKSDADACVRAVSIQKEA